MPLTVAKILLIVAILLSAAACSVTDTGHMAVESVQITGVAKSNVVPDGAYQGVAYYTFTASATMTSLPSDAYVNYSLSQGSAVLNNGPSSFFAGIPQGSYTLTVTAYGYGRAKNIFQVAIGQGAASISLP